MLQTIKAVEESSGVISMIRWVLRASTYIYGYTVFVVSGYWLYHAITTKNPDWIAGVSIMGTTGLMKGVSEFAKVMQKKEEVKGEIAETNAIVNDKNI